ncbi:OadG family transporter subunit [Anaerolinea sp.]|uniref:OadG family transporter subunit n=1 Tax=Anaerolinea sp. TaxID=1872519 RepID=UPI002ACED600|nr:OadG family transporter subunit [Anaerolinea sp.]
MNGDFLQGLTVSVLGILITFIALGVFILIMIVLQRLFPYREEEEEQAETAQIETRQPAEETAVSQDGEIVAAIAAAVAYLRLRANPQLGNSFQEGRSRWWFSRRLEAIEGKTRKR